METSKEDNLFGRMMFEELSIFIKVQHQEHVSKAQDLSEDVLESMRSEVLRWIAWIELLPKANAIDDVNWMWESNNGRCGHCLPKHCDGRFDAA